MKLEKLKQLIKQMSLQTEEEIVQCLLACFKEYQSYSKSTLISCVRQAMSLQEDLEAYDDAPEYFQREKPSFRNKLKLLSTSFTPETQEFISKHNFQAEINQNLTFKLCITSLKQHTSIRKEGSPYFTIKKGADLQFQLNFKSPTVGSYNCKLSLISDQNNYTMQIAVVVNSETSLSQNLQQNDLRNENFLSKHNLSQSLIRDNDSSQFLDFKAELNARQRQGPSLDTVGDLDGDNTVQSERARRLLFGTGQQYAKVPSGTSKKAQKAMSVTSSKTPHFDGYDLGDQGMLADVLEKLGRRITQNQEPNEIKNKLGSGLVDDADGDEFTFGANNGEPNVAQGTTKLRPRSKPIQRCDNLLDEIVCAKDRIENANATQKTSNRPSSQPSGPISAKSPAQIISESTLDEKDLVLSTGGPLKPRSKKKGTKKRPSTLDNDQIDQMVEEQKQKAIERTQEALTNFQISEAEIAEHKQYHIQYEWLVDQNFPDTNLEKLLA